jgi:hypothetical protein
MDTLLMVLNFLEHLLPAESWQTVVAVLVAAWAFIKAVAGVIGAASMLVAALRKAVPWLQAKAMLTESRADDNAALAYASFLDAAAEFCDAARHALELPALNRFIGEVVTRSKAAKS